MTIPKLYGTDEVVVYRSHNHHTDMPYVSPLKLKAFLTGNQYSTNMLIDKADAHEKRFEELSARLAVLEGLTVGYKDFIDYLKGAHPEVFVEYIESRKASDRLTS